MPYIRVLILKVTEDYINEVLETGHYYSSSLPAEEKLSGDFILLGQSDMGPFVAAVGRISNIRKMTSKDIKALTPALAEGFNNKNWEYIYDLEFEFSLPDNYSQENYDIAADWIKDGDGYDAFIDNTVSHTQTYGYKDFACLTDFTNAKNILKNHADYQKNNNLSNKAVNINDIIKTLRSSHKASQKATKAQAEEIAKQKARKDKEELDRANRIQHVLECKPEELKKLYKAGDTYKVKKHNPNGLVKIKSYDAKITDVENITWHDPIEPEKAFVCGQRLNVRIDALDEDAVYEVGTINIVQ